MTHWAPSHGKLLDKIIDSVSERQEETPLSYEGRCTAIQAALAEASGDDGDLDGTTLTALLAIAIDRLAGLSQRQPVDPMIR